MSVGFGFSVGDFITAIEVIGHIIDSLQEAGGASTQYRELVRELYTLEHALFRVKKLDIDDVDREELAVLQQAAVQCQQTIDDFWQKTAKYQKHLRSGGSGSKVKDGWMRLKWVLCKKEDVDEFKVNLRVHTAAIEVLLTAALTSAVTRQGRHQRSVASKIQESFNQVTNTLNALANAVAGGLEQGKQLLEMMANVVRTNAQVFQMLYTIQKQVTSVPGQVDFSKAVYLVDALDKPAPFQLEFIRSWEALVSVLKANFSGIDRATEKIERGEFILQETATQRILDVSKNWDTCFRPGQRVTMSMIFRGSCRESSTCPNCQTTCDGPIQGDKKCAECGLIFQDAYTASEVGLPYMAYMTLLLVFLREYSELAKDEENYPVGPRALTCANDLDEMRQYRRVNIIAPHPMGSRPEFGEMQSTIKEFLVNDLLVVSTLA